MTNKGKRPETDVIDDIEVDESEKKKIKEIMGVTPVLSEDEIKEYIEDIKKHPVVKDLYKYQRTGDVFFHVIKSVEKEKVESMEFKLSEEEIEEIAEEMEEELEKEIEKLEESGEEE